MTKSVVAILTENKDSSGVIESYEVKTSVGSIYRLTNCMHDIQDNPEGIIKIEHGSCLLVDKSSVIDLFTMGHLYFYKNGSIILDIQDNNIDTNAPKSYLKDM